jgi:transcriptional regulator with XRE-family HTH domain
MSTGHKQGPGVVEHLPIEMPNRDETMWRRWMTELGQQIRRLRELVGLSQQDLARLASVSQGAVSRLETARGLATPLLIVVKINLALAAELRKLDATVSNADLCRTRGVQDLLRWPEGALGSDAVHCSPDPMFEAFVRLFRETSERHRDGLLAIMRTAVAALQEQVRLDE